mmetsp:Transcript_71234/g.133222  ORF Transcript_71234/g.133222 Transcript_71234/m.133222 type:complete len:466 (+) Transcript_71234:44-1441(+)
MARVLRTFFSCVVYLLLDVSMALMHSSFPTHLVGGESRRRPDVGVHAQWLAKNGDAQRTGASHEVAPRNLAMGPSWEWREPGAEVVRSTPLIDEEQNVVLSTLPGDIFKFSRSGELLWKFSAGSDLPAVPAMMDGVVYQVRNDGVILAVDLQTGELLWDLKVDQESSGDCHALLAVDGLVIASVGSAAVNGFTPPHIFAAISVKDRKEVWRFTGAAFYNFLPASYNGSLVFEDTAGVVYRLDLKDGSVIWQKDPPVAPEYRSFTAAGVTLDNDGNIYAAHNHNESGEEQGVVTARRFSDGELLWHRRFEHAANAGPAVGRLEGTEDSPLAVFVPFEKNPPFILNVEEYALEDGNAYALDAHTGETLWRYDFAPWYGPPRGDTIQHLCWPDAFASPAVDGRGTVYIGRADGLLYTMHDDNHDKVIDASEVSTYDATQAYQGTPAISDGMLALADCSGLRVFMLESP